MRTLRQGDSGPEVRLLQRILAAAGVYRLPTGDVFDTETTIAVHIWQHARGLAVDGVVGPATWASLEVELPLAETAGASHQLTPHFRLEEFACNHCQRVRLRYLPQLSDLLEQIRSRAGVPLTISSGYRCRALNDELVREKKASSRSQHMLGRAADLHFAGPTVDQVADIADALLGAAGGVGRYHWGVHVDLRPDRGRWDWR